MILLALAMSVFQRCNLCLIRCLFFELCNARFVWGFAIAFGVWLFRKVAGYVALLTTADCILTTADCIIFILSLLIWCVCAAGWHMASESETGAYMVGVWSEPLIVLSKDIAKLARAPRLVNLACDIRRARQTFFCNPWIYWWINVRITNWVKWEWRLNLCVYLAVDLSCYSAWMVCLAFVFF